MTCYIVAPKVVEAKVWFGKEGGPLAKPQKYLHAEVKIRMLEIMETPLR
jgi:hypothetical protein